MEFQRIVRQGTMVRRLATRIQGFSIRILAKLLCSVDLIAADQETAVAMDDASHDAVFFHHDLVVSQRDGIWPSSQRDLVAES